MIERSLRSSLRGRSRDLRRRNRLPLWVLTLGYCCRAGNVHKIMQRTENGMAPDHADPADMQASKIERNVVEGLTAADESGAGFGHLDRVGMIADRAVDQP